MTIKDFLSTRDYALIEAEFEIKNFSILNVVRLNTQVFFDIEDQLNELLEFDILPDCVEVKKMGDKWYYISILLDITDPEDFKIEETLIEEYPSVDLDFFKDIDNPLPF